MWCAAETYNHTLPKFPPKIIIIDELMVSRVQIPIQRALIDFLETVRLDVLGKDN